MLDESTINKLFTDAKTAKKSNLMTNSVFSLQLISHLLNMYSPINY